jgi:hypothetical protein
MFCGGSFDYRSESLLQLLQVLHGERILTPKPGKTLAVSLVVFLAALGGSTALAQTKAAEAAKPSKSAAKSAKAPKTAKPAKDAATATSTKAGDKLTYDGPEVLDPSKFFGAAAMGYASAKACPEVVSRLFCYCGCDISDNHNTLIDCFTSNHGVDCHICQEEAVMALKMHRDNASIAEIQKAIDQEFSAKYPWKEDSPAYTKYKTTRLWSAKASASTGSKPDPIGTGSNKDETAGPEPEQSTEAKGSSPGTKKKSASAKNVERTASGANSETKNKKWTPVLKPGAKAGACCSKEQEEKK